MATSRATRVLIKQLEDAMKDKTRGFRVCVDPSNVFRWFVLFTGLGGDLADGEYIFRIIAPEDFPMSPPAVYAETPNGVFVPGDSICLSIGVYHANDAPGKDGAHGWRPALGMAGFITNVMNSMIVHEGLHGVGIRVESPAVKRELAKSSRDFNAAAWPHLEFA